MKKLFYSLKDKIITNYQINIGVIILFSTVAVIFLISLLKIYI